MKTLVLGAGGNVSQGIIKAIRETKLPIEIIGACISEYSKGLYMCDEAYISPYANDPKFISWVIDFCNEHDIDIIFTGVEENIIELAKNEELIRNNTKTIFISSSYEQLLVGQDKFLTCEFLKNSGCNFPKYKLWDGISTAIEFAETTGYPIIAKPRNGKSAKGLHLFKTRTDIEEFRNLQNYVLEECVGNDNSEYTVGCYVDKHGVLQELFPMRRKLYNGTTVWAQTEHNDHIIRECTRICEAFKPKGPLNIQLRIDKSGIPVCFEMNVRFSGTTAIRSHFGFQDVKAMILEYLYDEDISDCFHFKTGEVFRFDEEFYLPEQATTRMMNNKMIKNMRDFING